MERIVPRRRNRAMKPEPEAPVDPHRMVKRSVDFEAADYAWALGRSTELYGRRGMGLYLRKLIKLDREWVERIRGSGLVSHTTGQGMMYPDGKNGPNHMPP